jgi:hypothetical protein
MRFCPGYSAFNRDDVLAAFYAMMYQGYTVRLKDPTESDAAGQCVVADERELLTALDFFSDQQLAEAGLVLEANVREPVVYSIGQVQLDADVFSYFGQQFSVSHQGRAKYGGTRLTMIRGSLSDLSGVVRDEGINLAVQQANRVFSAYSIYNPILSRANFDVVQGKADDGSQLSGVTDQSLRLGGASPAEVMAISYLKNMPCTTVSAEVSLDYDPEPDQKRGKIFLDDPTLCIHSKIIGYT